jgi:ubiquinone/menaquinone biosynthesis C-methylase UbiE
MKTSVAGGPSPAVAQTELLDRLLRNESDVAYKRRLRRMVSYLELAPGETIVDCGTGMGFYLKVISELCPTARLLGIDCDARVLRYARTHLAQRGAVVVQGDIQHLGVAAESIDGAVMSEVLEHVDDDAGALREVWRALRRGGVLAISVPSSSYPFGYDPVNWVLERLLGRPIRNGPFAGLWANHKRLYSREELVAAVERAGFRIECLEELTHYCFPGTQFIVYTLGKSLVERNLLPDFLSRSAHRFRGEDNSGSRLNPMNWALGLFNWVDRFNEDSERVAGKGSFVNLAIKARKV